MFRALSVLNKSSEEFRDQNTFLNNQTNTFTKKLPNLVLTPTLNTSNLINNLKLAEPGLRTWDPNTRQSSLRDIDIAAYTQSIYTSQELQNLNQECRTASLDTIINTMNLNKPVRCGWLYKEGASGDRPDVSSGFLGTPNGPLDSLSGNPGGRWYWNLDDAKKKILTNRCSHLTSCKNVGSENYKNCAYSTTKGIGVPVDNNGDLLYPDDIVLSAPPSSLVTKPNNCPPPPAPGSPEYQRERSRNICMPLPDGRLSRDCMLEQVVAAGCKQGGALYDALLYNAAPMNYAAGLQDTLSFKKYQQLSSKPLTDNVIRTGRTTVELALNNFRDLANESSTAKETALNYAARDLCLNDGQMEKFDFCTELLPESGPPYTLDCLQKAWKAKGGSATGTSFPTLRNLGSYEATYSKWSQYLGIVNEYSLRCKSTDKQVQDKALKEFLGIDSSKLPTNRQIGWIDGIEILCLDINIFMIFKGRYNASKPDKSRIGFFNVGFTNFRPNNSISIKSFNYGANILRKSIDDYDFFDAKRNMDYPNFDHADKYGLEGEQKCINLEKDGPNYLMLVPRVDPKDSDRKPLPQSELPNAPEYITCNNEKSGKITNGFTLTQEPDAPMISWEGMKSRSKFYFCERRMPTTFLMVTNFLQVVTGQNIKENKNPSLKYPAVLKIDNDISYMTSLVSFTLLSWNTLTVSFIMHSNKPGPILTLRRADIKYLVISVTNKSTISIEWKSTTLQFNKELPLPAINVPVYIMVCMHPNTSSTYPSRVSVYVNNFGSFNSKNIINASTSGNQPIIDATMDLLITLGLPDTNTKQPVDISIGSIRLFDYVLNQEQMSIDQNNTWQMKYLT